MLHDTALPDLRRTQLVAALGAAGWLRASELAERLGVSVDTIRRDLDLLAAEGRVRRVRGGAQAVVPAAPDDGRGLDARLAAGDDPGRGARAAALAALLPQRGLVVLAGGATCVEVARRLPAGVQVLTPSPAAALAAAERGVEVRVTGGRLDGRHGVLCGPDACRELARARADVLVLAPCGLDAVAGVTMHARDEADLVAAASERAERVLAATPADRLGTRAAWGALEPAALDVVVCDAAEDDPRLAALDGLRAERVLA